MSPKRKRAPNPKPVCRICGQSAPKPTEEHAYPRWLLRMMAAGTGGQGARKVVLKPVCRPCQARLNDYFEIPAKPLLEVLFAGQAFEMTAHQQATLAAWFVKTALVVGLARDQNQTTFSPGAADRVREVLVDTMRTGTPAHGTIVRLGLMSPLISFAPAVPLVPQLPRDMTAVTSVLMLGKGLLLEIIINASNPLMMHFLAATKHDDRLVRMWPQFVPETVRWPPTLLPLTAHAELMQGWNHSPGALNAVLVE